MKTLVYTIIDDTMGIHLMVEAELVDWQSSEPPTIIIQDISHCGKPVMFWCLSETYKDRLIDKVFQQWCLEGIKK
jgi:hypothetical protein